MTYLITLLGLALVGVIVAATRSVIHHREETRRIARETEHLNVMSDDTRRAFWVSAADHHHVGDSHSSDSSSGGDGGGGD